MRFYKKIVLGPIGALALIYLMFSLVTYSNDAKHQSTLEVLKHGINENQPVGLEIRSKLFNYSKSSIFLHNSPVSKDLVVYSAYFDDRPRDNHDNVTVILFDVSRKILNWNWILGCGADSFVATNFSLYSLYENYLMHRWLGKRAYPYENMEVLCYDLPVKNGSNAFVVYTTSGKQNDVVAITSALPVRIPAPKVSPVGEYNFTVITCSKTHDRNVFWIQEFIRYQKTIGVDHVHMNFLDTFIKDGGFKDYIVSDPFMKKALKEGFLSYSVWPKWYKEKEVYLNSSILRHLDCAFRFRGKYDYVFIGDPDDFFTPRVPGRTSLKYYIEQYCLKKPAASCRFDWTWYAPNCGLNGKIGADGNVTRHLKSHKVLPSYRNWKSVHSSHALLDASFHSASCDKCLLPGYEYVQVPEHVAYVAHNRMNQECEKGRTRKRLNGTGPQLATIESQDKIMQL